MIVLTQPHQKLKQWYQSFLLWMRFFLQCLTGIYAGVIYLFLIDLCLFFVHYTLQPCMVIALYCMLLAYAYTPLLVWTFFWIGLISLYTHGFMFLYYITLIPLSMLVITLKRFFYPTPITPITTFVLFLFFNYLALHCMGFSPSLHNCTIVYVFAIIISVWLLFKRVMHAGE